jgi:hypothetical protein
MSEKSQATEQRLTDMMARGILGPMTIIKPNDTSRHTQTVMAADPDFSLPVEANLSYVFRCYLNYEGGPTAASDLKWTWSVPTSAVMRYGLTWVDTAGATHLGQTWAGADTLVVRTNGAGALLAAYMFGSVRVAANAGPVTLNWAQNTSHATDTIIHAGSTMELGMGS